MVRVRVPFDPTGAAPRHSMSRSADLARRIRCDGDTLGTLFGQPSRSLLGRDPRSLRCFTSRRLCHHPSGDHGRRRRAIPSSLPRGYTASASRSTSPSPSPPTSSSAGDPAYISQTVIDATGGAAAITIPAGVTPMPVVQGFTIQGGSDGIAAASKVQLLDNRVTGNGDGVDYQDSGGVARGNVIEGNGDDGLDLDGATALLIEDNVIQNNGDDGIEVRLHPYTGVALEIIIRGNIIAGNEEDGIQLIDYAGLSSRVFRIERNLIRGNGMVGLAMMADGNTVEDFSGAPLPEPVLLIHNTFVSQPYHVTGGANLTAGNNIFVGATAVALKNVAGSSTIRHSLFWNNAAQNQASNVDGSTAIIADPLLDATFRPRPGSPAIDAGTTVGLSYAGSAPDLGAYEAGATAASALAVKIGPAPGGTVDTALTFTGLVTGGRPPTPSRGASAMARAPRGPLSRTSTPASGTYTVRLTATDAAGAQATDTATVTIGPARRAGSAAAEAKRSPSPRRRTPR